MQPTATVLVYSDDANTREQVRLAAGRRPAADVPPVRVRGVRDAARGAVRPGQRRHRRVRAGRRDRSGRRHGRVPADQGRDLPVPAGAGADRPPAGRLAGHLEPRGRRRHASRWTRWPSRTPWRGCCATAADRRARLSAGARAAAILERRSGTARRAGRRAALLTCPGRLRPARSGWALAHDLGPQPRGVGGGRCRRAGAALRALPLLPLRPRSGSSRRSRCRRAPSSSPSAVDDLDEVAVAHVVEEPVRVARCSCRCSRG